MPDITVGGVDIGYILAPLTVVMLPLQAALYLKAKKKWLRLLPMLVSALLIAVFLIAAMFLSDWEQVGFVMLAVSLIPLLITAAVGVGLGAWLRRMKERSSRK